MLHRLHIQNYAIIEEIDIRFSGQMSAITGETGAGKSILMGALSLILGARADSAVLGTARRKCVVEGSFVEAQKTTISRFLEEQGLDQEEELVIRREIAANGKSRAFINDTPVSLEQLRKLCYYLIDLHQQFDELELGRSGFQLQVLDALAGHRVLLEEYRGMFRQWSILQKEWSLLRDQQGQWEKESDYRRFLFDELSTAAFREHELEDLDSELQRLNHAETIQEKLAQASADLQDGERPAIQLIRSAIGQLNALQRFHPGLSDLAGRMRSAQLELEDIYSELGRIRQDSEQDPGRIEQLNERMALGYRLLKKHGVRETSDLLAIQHDLESKLRATLDLSNLLDAKAKQAGLVKEELERVAAQLSRNRLDQVNLLEQNVNRLLSQVGMPNARLQVAVRPITMQESGTDNAEFLFDANRSNRFEPVGKVASGGELSRLMLCIKSLVAQSMDLPTMVFDEIDAGISGEAARQVANILYGISRTRQVICITHQAQIAGKADAHFLVFKESVGGPAVTRIRLLKKEERVTAIAQMLGGEKPTAAALANAKEMMTQ